MQDWQNMSSTNDWVIEISNGGSFYATSEMGAIRIGSHLLGTLQITENRFYVDRECQVHRDCILDSEQLKYNKALLNSLILTAGYYHAVQYNRCKVGKI